MFTFLRKLMSEEPKDNCMHQWHILTNEKVYDYYTEEVEDGHIIFCPKCQGEKTVTKRTWHKIEKKMEINAQYLEEEKQRQLEEVIL